MLTYLSKSVKGVDTQQVELVQGSDVPCVICVWVLAALRVRAAWRTGTLC
jgi:hypothetical protein